MNVQKAKLSTSNEAKDFDATRMFGEIFECFQKTGEEIGNKVLGWFGEGGQKKFEPKGGFEKSGVCKDAYVGPQKELKDVVARKCDIRGLEEQLQTLKPPPQPKTKELLISRHIHLPPPGAE